MPSDHSNLIMIEDHRRAGSQAERERLRKWAHNSGLTDEEAQQLIEEVRREVAAMHGALRLL